MNDRKTKVCLPITNEGRKVKIVPSQPVIFLAGPIRNAPHWQDDAIRYLLDKNVDVFVASPRRAIEESLKSFVELDNPGYELFPRQRAWEQYYLYQAADDGCILFYLPKEAEVKDDLEKVYAHITMMELGEWIARHKANPSMNLVIATDGNFPEWSTIEFELRTEGITSIFTSLEEGLDEVIKNVTK